MKCGRHNQEDGGPGVCAACLRECLRDLVAVRTDHSLRPQYHPPAQVEAQAQPLAVPSSVHPMPCRLPHVSSGSTEPGPSSAAAGWRSGSAKFSILSTLFGRFHSRRRPTSEEPDPDRGAPESPRPGNWFHGFIHGHQKRKNKKEKNISRLHSADDAMATASRRRMSGHGREQGLSPEPRDSAPESGYITESPGRGWWQPTPSPRRRGTAEHYHHGRGLAGFAVCLSPLVRPGGPSRRRFQGCDLGFPDDLQRVISPHHRRQAAVSEPALCRDRSRKLADLGKFR